MTWESRIVGHGEEDPNQLAANPRNWRIHPQTQQDALAGVLDEVGWVQQVVVNQRSGYVVDGHLRVMLAMQREEDAVPVTYVDLSEEEERLILATLDPLSAMAGTDREVLADLLASVESQDAGVTALLASINERHVELPHTDDVPSVLAAAELVKSDRSRFKVFHAAVPAKEFFLDGFHYLISFAEARKDIPNRGPSSLLFVDSGLLTGAREAGRAFISRQPEMAAWADQIGADWCAMMDVPSIPAVLGPLHMTPREGLTVHLQKAEEFASLPMAARKVFVVQSPGQTLEAFRGCATDMRDFVREEDVVAIGGGLKDRSDDPTFIEAVTAVVHEVYPTNDIHLFGVNSPTAIQAGFRRGATSCDSSTAVQALSYGKVILATKGPSGYVARQTTLTDLTPGIERLSVGGMLYVPACLFSMAMLDLTVLAAVAEEAEAMA